ncbi:MAG: VacJ family lipoprotein [Polaromonas sp.]
MNTFNAIKKSLSVMALGLVVVLAQGCATGPNANPADPMEPLNRAVFNFNDGLDRALLQPVATAYDQVTPSPVKTGVRNFFGNISDVWSVVNNLLQGKLKESLETFMRVSVNSTFGFGGVLDIGTEAGLAKNRQNFGQTLGVWGFDAGPYVVLPLFGPSSVRDTVGTVVDGSADVVNNLRNVPTRNSLAVLRVVDKRAELLGATNILDQAALDKYSFTRDLYLQRRASSIGKDSAVKEERFDLPAPPAK